MSRTEARDTFGRPQQDGFRPELCYLVELHIQNREHLRPFSLQTPTTFGVGCCLEYIFFPSYPCQNCVIRQTSYQRGCSLLVQFWNNILMPRKVSQGRLKIALLSVLCLFPSLHHLKLTHRREVCYTITWTPVCGQRREKERASGGFLN